jgi:HEAT repeat protein
LVNMVFLAGWIAIAYGVRREYLNVLRQAIERRTLDPERTAAGVLDSTTMEELALGLQRGEEQQVMYGLSLFEMGRESGWHPALRKLLEHSSPAVRQRALRLLSDAGDREILPLVEKLLGDESVEVRTEALRYLVVHTGRDPLSLLTTETNFPDYCLQGAVVVYLVRNEGPEHLTAAKIIFESMLSGEGAEGALARAEAARVLGVIPPSCELQIELPKLLNDSDPDVAKQALLSAGKLGNRELLPLIIQKLARPGLIGAARTALVQHGDRAVGTLKDYLNNAGVLMLLRKQIPEVLVRIGTPNAAAALADSLIQSDPGLRFDVQKALNKVRRRDPGLLTARDEFADMLEMEVIGYYRSLQVLAAFDPEAISSRHVSTAADSLLTRALHERMNHEIERIFRLLALLYPPRDIYNAYVGVTSGRPQFHANALEVLEHVLRTEHYRMLACALDPEVSTAERLRYSEQISHTRVNSKVDALRILLHCGDRWLCACALHSIGELQIKELWQELRRVPHQGDTLLDETWNWASSRLALSATT